MTSIPSEVSKGLDRNPEGQYVSRDDMHNKRIGKQS
jgi:hypothetical protein